MLKISCDLLLLEVLGAKALAAKLINVNVVKGLAIGWSSADHCYNLKLDVIVP